MILTDGRVQGTDRANTPASWRHSRCPAEVPDGAMDWHHAIPWNVLRDCWDGLVQFEQWSAVEEFLYLASVGKPGDKVRAMKNGGLSGGDRDEIHQNICWPTWNIVEGPAKSTGNRTDDPGEAFDAFRNGMSGNESTRHQTLAALHQDMEKVIAAVGEVVATQQAIAAAAALPGPAAPARAEELKQRKTALATKARALEGSLGRMKAYKNSPIIFFKTSMWKKVVEGRLERSGARLERPHQWAKA